MYLNNKLKMKSVLLCLVGLLAVGYVGAGVAADCTTDQNQMLKSISKYGDIGSTDCPDKIKNVKRASMGGNNYCIAACILIHGEDRPCVWKVGDWGNTLSCP